MTSPSTYRPDIDGLRAIAVLSVLLFHLDVSVFSGGFIGVDVFFVISGFLITRLIVDEVNNTGGFSFSRFYVRRLRRLFPAFLTVLVLTLVAAVITFSPSDLSNLGGSALHAVFSVSNIYFWQEAGYFDDAIKLNPLLHTWSLSVEEQFYLVWPAMVLFVASRWGMGAVIKALLIVIVSSLLLNFAFDQSVILYFWPNTASQNLEDVRAAMFYLGPFRNFELGLGALLVFFMDKRFKNEFYNEVIFIIGLVLILVPMFIYSENIIFPSYNALVPCIGTTMVIYAGNPKTFGRILDNRVAIWIGLISYSLYLVHWPIITFYKYLNFNALSASEQFSLALISIVVAFLIYKFIEQPFRRPSLNVSAALPNGQFITSISAVSIVAVLVSSNMWANNGWLWRVDSERREVLSRINNPGQFHVNYYGGKDCKPHLFCSVNADKEPNIFFVGDSHSQAYAYGLAEAFPDYKFTHLDNRCEYSTFDYCYKGKYHQSNFVERKAKDFEFLKNSADKIIIAQNWGFKPDHYNTKTGEVIAFDSLQEYAVFLASEIDKVANYLGRDRIIIIGQVHRFGGNGNPLSCISTPIVIDHCKTVRGRFAYRFNLLFEKELKARGLPFLSPTAVMCENKLKCLNIGENKLPLFSDSHHLSIWGSELVVNGFKESLESFFN